ncbi:MAG: NAD-dependent succinate-semialdehyde dehydrogenase [Thermodesulfobacteriota bacterium]
MTLPLKDKSLWKEEAFVNGAWLPAASGDTIPVFNPADGREIGKVPDLAPLEIQAAVQCAHEALGNWRSMTAKKRSGILRRWFELILRNQDDLAAIMTAEQGKPFAEARGEIAYAAAFVEWFAEEAKRAYGDIIPSPMHDSRILVLKAPVGVCAAITPWNFPAAMITRKAAPALAAGCTMIVKPASQTPFSALALAELAVLAGIPPGVLNIVTGRSESVGPVLTGHPLVRKLSFTGSTATGKLLMQQCAGTVKKVSLELGGHAPFLVFADADPDEAVAGAMASKYRNSGQTCICANRFLVQAPIYEAFTERLAAAAGRLKVADGFEEGAQQGPLIDMPAVQKVTDQIRDAVAKGAKILLGGNRHALGGTFFEPTVLGEVTSDMRIAQEETFGPVAPVFRFQTEEEAVRLANLTEYGLAAYLYTRDMGRIWRVAEALEYGMVGINTGSISTESAPFGGMKQSGIGREGSRYGMDEYLEIKYLCLGGVSNPHA